MPAYQPPFQLTHRMTAPVDIAERPGGWKAANRDLLVQAKGRLGYIGPKKSDRWEVL